MGEIAWEAITNQAVNIAGIITVAFVVASAVQIILCVIMIAWTIWDDHKGKKLHTCHNCAKNRNCKSAFCPWVSKDCKGKEKKK